MKRESAKDLENERERVEESAKEEEVGWEVVEKDDVFGPEGYGLNPRITYSN